MTWSNIFTSSIGRKLIMGATGIFLLLFLLVHCYLNALVFAGDGGKTFDEAAHFMGTNWIMHLMEVGLFAGFFFHIFQGLYLTFSNKKKRSQNYTIKPGNATSKWYSRSMGLLGSIILLFLILHLSAFWAPNRYSQISGNGEINLFEKMAEAFSNPFVVIIYILGCISLAFHLMHGFKSAFQTFGINSPKYAVLINACSFFFSYIIPFVFALIPIGFYFNWFH